MCSGKLFVIKFFEESIILIQNLFFFPLLFIVYKMNSWCDSVLKYLVVWAALAVMLKHVMDGWSNEKAAQAAAVGTLVIYVAMMMRHSEGMEEVAMEKANGEAVKMDPNDEDVATATCKFPSPNLAMLGSQLTWDYSAIQPYDPHPDLIGFEGDNYYHLKEGELNGVLGYDEIARQIEATRQHDFEQANQTQMQDDLYPQAAKASGPLRPLKMEYPQESEDPYLQAAKASGPLFPPKMEYPQASEEKEPEPSKEDQMNEEFANF